MPNSPAEVRMLDSGYAREARSLLYHAYRHDPTFAYLFEADRPGYDQRVRATVRELVQQHFSEDLPAIGLLQLGKLPIDAVPDITNRQVQINTVAPALTPEQIERFLNNL